MGGAALNVNPGQDGIYGDSTWFRIETERCTSTNKDGTYMRLRASAVTVKQLPEKLNFREGRTFFKGLEGSMNVDRPSIVLDCSKLRQMDGSAMHLLLCCLEEAMKRNGDVRLAGVPAEARAILERTGAKRLFKIFDTNADAVNSFYQRPVHAAWHANVGARPHPTSEIAA